MMTHGLLSLSSLSGDGLTTLNGRKPWLECSASDVTSSQFSTECRASVCGRSPLSAAGDNRRPRTDLERPRDLPGEAGEAGEA